MCIVALHGATVFLPGKCIIQDNKKLILYYRSDGVNLWLGAIRKKCLGEDFLTFSTKYKLPIMS